METLTSDNHGFISVLTIHVIKRGSTHVYRLQLNHKKHPTVPRSLTKTILIDDSQRVDYDLGVEGGSAHNVTLLRISLIRTIFWVI